MKRAFAVLALLLLASSVAFASEKADWWTNLKNKARKITPTKTTTTTTAVGGLRGTKEGEEALYWKGKEVSVAKEELESFNSALDLAISGEVYAAKEGFEGFLRSYPQSALADDARQSLRMLNK